MTAPITPLVSDALLAEWADPDFDALRGEFDVETRAMLATALPEICGELLLWRQTAANHPCALALALRSEAIEMRLEQARQTVRADHPVSRSEMRAACQTLLRHSTDATERDAAAYLMAAMSEAA